MKITVNEKKVFINHVKELLTNEHIHEMKKYIQHGNTSTFTHCLIVAYYSYSLALLLPVRFDTKSIIRGAMLRDFYLYDWHIPDESHKLHGFIHPKIALNNAKKHFILNSIEEDIIEKHMWPLTPRKYPIYKEAKLVCFIDKLCSLAETLYIPILPKNYRTLQRLLSGVMIT